MSRTPIVGVEELNGMVPRILIAVAQEANGGGPGNQWLGSSRSMADVQDINVGSPGNQQLRPCKSLVGVQDTNGHESRKPMAGAQEPNVRVPGNQVLDSR